MAARGMIRVASQIHKSHKCDLYIRKGIVSSLQSSSTATSLLICQKCKCLGSRGLHYLVSAQNDRTDQLLLVNPVWSIQYNRLYKTTEHSDGEENLLENNDDAVNGAFEKFGLSEETKSKLRAMGIQYLFPVQYHTFEATLEGTDVIVQARTGTGKTLSFAIPIVEKLQRNSNNRLRTRGRKPLVLVLAPTRELANQVQGEFAQLSDKIAVTCVYGGVSMTPQVQAIRSGVDVLVGTPGRTKDLMNQGVLDLSQIEHVILDEVDRMLDMGFAEQVEDIIRDCYSVGEKPQTMLYSATMPDWVKRTAKKYLDSNYKMINLVGSQSEQTATTVKQYAILCRSVERPTLINDLVKVYTERDGRAIVFCQTKKEVDELCSGVLKKDAKGLHGDIAQASRSYILKGFKEGAFKILITTDVAARGLDIANVDLVIQAQPPTDVSYYIHRVGRTGRAGKSGMSILLYERSQTSEVRQCEQMAKVRLEMLSRPTVGQMLDICVKNSVTDILAVPEDLAEHFYEAAEMMVSEKGAKEMLAAAMALVSRASSYSNRSLITHQEGYCTLLYRSGKSAGSYGSLMSTVPGYMKELNVLVQNIHLLQDKTGVVFDVESENVQTVLNGFDNIRSQEDEHIDKVKDLPAIIERQSRTFDTYQSQGRHSRSVQSRRHRFDFDDDSEGYNAEFPQRSRYGRSKSVNRFESKNRNFKDRFDSENDGDDHFDSAFSRKPYNNRSQSASRFDSRSRRQFGDRDDFDPDYDTFRPSNRGKHGQKKREDLKDMFEEDS